MSAVSWAIGAAALVLGAIFIIPLTFRVRAAYGDDPNGRTPTLEVDLGITFEIGLGQKVTLWRARIPVGDLLRAEAARTLERIVKLAWAGPVRSVRPAPGSRRKMAVTLALATRVNWRNLTWQTRLGLSDAALTAVAAGALWAVKGSLASLALSRLRLGPGLPRIAVVPDFSGAGLWTRLEGIGVLRVGHIIFVLPQLAIGSRASGATLRGRRDD
jgi:hypothetical protein